MERRPPEFEPHDLARFGSESVEGVSFLNEEDGPDDGLRWSDIAPAFQNTLVQMWLSQPWPSLSSFCASNGLRYSSVHAVFSRRQIPTTRQQMRLREDEVVKRALVRNHSANQQWARIAEFVGDRVVQLLLGYDAYSLDDLRKIASHAASMMNDTASAAKTLSGSVGDLLTNTEVSVKRTQTLLPPDIRARLLGQMSSVAESAVRAAERISP